MSSLALLICGLEEGSVPAGLAAGCELPGPVLCPLAGGLSLVDSSREAFRKGEMATGLGTYRAMLDYCMVTLVNY